MRSARSNGTPWAVLALLRGRGRAWHPRLGDADRAALTAAPLLLHGAFAGAPGGEPAGIDGFVPRVHTRRVSGQPGAGTWTGPARGPRVISAVFAIPGATGLTFGVLPFPGTPRAPLLRRLAEVERVLGATSTGARVQVLEPEALELPMLCALLTWGALCAGRPPPSFWARVAALAQVRLQPPELRVLAEGAPTPLARLTLALLTTARPALPWEVLAAHVAAHPPWTAAAADPEWLLVRWARTSSGWGPELSAVLAWSSRVDSVRRAARLQAATSPLVTVGRRLGVEAVRALRASGQLTPALRRQVRRELLADGVPSFLLPSIAAESREAPTLTEYRTRRGIELRGHGGAVLGRGATPEQARVRALALIAAARGEAPRLSGAPAAWSKISAALEAKVERRTLVLVAHPAPAGLEGEDALLPGRCVALLLRPDTRPSSWLLRAEAAIARALRERTCGTRVEVCASAPDAEPAASRLNSVVRALGPRDPTAPPLGVELGPSIYVCDARKVRRFRVDRWADRPRRVQLLSHETRAFAETGRFRTAMLETVECLVASAGADQAVLQYRDLEGCHFREHVRSQRLEAWLRETRTLLQQGPRPVSLAVRAAADLVALGGRCFGEGEPVTEVQVRVTLPFRIELRLAQDGFGGPGQPGWSAAAQVLLSRWPVGTRGQILLTRVELPVLLAQRWPLLRLYARRVALRRLGIALARCHT